MTDAQNTAPQPDASIQVTPYVMQKLGIVPGNTFINVEHATIACVPFKISQTASSFLAAVSPNEMVHFQRYKNIYASVNMLLNTGLAQPVKIFARCTLKSILPVKGRENFCLFMVDWKPCPPDLLNAITGITFLYERLTNEFEEFKDFFLAVTPDISKAIGYNNSSVLVYEGKASKVAVFRFSSKVMDFLVPVAGPKLETEKPAQLKLEFKSYPIVVAGLVKQNTLLPNGAQKASVEVSFVPELVDIIENYRFIDSVSRKTDGSPA